MQQKKVVGTIIGGSLADGFTMRVDAGMSLDHLKAGTFVSIKGTEYAFFSMITNIFLEPMPQELIHHPCKPDTLFFEFIKKRYLHATAIVRPMIALDSAFQRKSVTSIPGHFSPVLEVTSPEIVAIFGSEQEDNTTYFSIGKPLSMDVSVCINLHKFLERSNGIFGKTGTGKTFLTRLVLAGIIKNTSAVTLIFDMHSEYGLQARKEGAGSQAFVKGLKTLFGHKIAIFSLDPDSTKRRGVAPDVAIRLSLQAVQVEDILSLQQELNLHPTACESAYLLEAKYRRQWLSVLLSSGDRLKELAQEIGCHPESLTALHRKLKQIERLPFFDATLAHDSVIDQLLEYLQRGISVIIEFGNFTSTFCYLLLANIITRRIHALYVEKTEKFLGSHKKEDEPRKLLITIEEAHKFLNPQTARQTIFGTIAREMRKYYVSLLVIDQRPSGIDQEIISQLGTKIVAQLSDEKDIQAILAGVPGAVELKTVLATLDSKKQVLLLGHATPMPIVVETRSYDEAFYAAVSFKAEMATVDQLY